MRQKSTADITAGFPWPAIRAATLFSISTAGIGLAALPAHAQLTGVPLIESPQFDQFASPNIPGTGAEPGVSVLSRSRPDYDPSGIHTGNFIIRPTLAETAGYDTNVLGTASPQGSSLLETTGGIAANSDWSRNSVQAAINFDNLRYLDLPRQSYTNWNATIGGTYQIGRDLLSANYTHLNLTQTALGLDTPQLDQPLAYSIDSAQLNYRVNFNRLFITPSVEVASYSYDSGTALGQPYLQNYRDRMVLAPAITAGYETSPQRNLLLVLREATANYQSHDFGIATRNYNDYSILAGYDYAASALVRFRALGGYELRSFNSTVYKPMAAPIIEGTVIWTPTGLTTVTGTASRHIQDASVETVASYTETLLQLRVDHEYLRNVLLRADTGVYFSQYPQNLGNQTLYTAGIGATYLLNRNMQIVAGYDFSARNSSNGANGGFAAAPAYNTLGIGYGFGANYIDNLFTLQFRLAL